MLLQISRDVRQACTLAAGLGGLGAIYACGDNGPGSATAQCLEFCEATLNSYVSFDDSGLSLATTQCMVILNS